MVDRDREAERVVGSSLSEVRGGPERAEGPKHHIAPGVLAEVPSYSWLGLPGASMTPDRGNLGLSSDFSFLCSPVF